MPPQNGAYKQAPQGALHQKESGQPAAPSLSPPRPQRSYPRCTSHSGRRHGTEPQRGGPCVHGGSVVDPLRGESGGGPLAPNRTAAPSKDVPAGAPGRGGGEAPHAPGQEARAGRVHAESRLGRCRHHPRGPDAAPRLRGLPRPQVACPVRGLFVVTKQAQRAHLPATQDGHAEQAQVLKVEHVSLDGEGIGEPRRHPRLNRRPPPRARRRAAGNTSAVFTSPSRGGRGMQRGDRERKRGGPPCPTESLQSKVRQLLGTEARARRSATRGPQDDRSQQNQPFCTWPSKLQLPQAWPETHSLPPLCTVKVCP